jgi:hypothetical protein
MAQTTLSGSCLCGTIRYEIVGEPKRFYHCHCKRCRKASGTGHATNMAVAADSIRWISGEDRIGYYKVPEAERFARQFCKECGSPLPRVVKEIDAVVVPAGSLDSDIAVMPQARIFWDSRAPWSCSGDDLDVFAEYPPTS